MAYYRLKTDTILKEIEHLELKVHKNTFFFHHTLDFWRDFQYKLWIQSRNDWLFLKAVKLPEELVTVTGVGPVEATDEDEVEGSCIFTSFFFSQYSASLFSLVTMRSLCSIQLSLKKVIRCYFLSMTRCKHLVLAQRKISVKSEK